LDESARVFALILAKVTAMLGSVVVWLAVVLAALAFAGFLFGLSSALTLVDRLIRPRALAPRLDHGVGGTPRLWA
jgi:hypothetical protein